MTGIKEAKNNKLQDAQDKASPELNCVSSNKIIDPLGPDCFRIHPFRFAFYIYLIVFTFFFFALLLIEPHMKVIVAITASSFYMAAICAFYFFWLVPAGNIGFLSRGKNGFWQISMGFFAFLIYNKYPCRKDFINRAFARILRTAAFDNRVERIAVKTWLFKPDDVPQYFPHPSEHKELKHVSRIVAMLPVYVMYLIANFSLYRFGRKRNSPLKAKFYWMVWDKKNLIDFFGDANIRIPRH